MSWSAPTPWPHYIRVDLGKKVKGVSFWYKGRNNGNNDNPKHITVWASNKAADNPTDAEAWKIGELGSDVLPKGTAPEYTSPGLFSEKMSSSISGCRLTKLIPAASGLLWPS